MTALILDSGSHQGDLLLRSSQKSGRPRIPVHHLPSNAHHCLQPWNKDGPWSRSETRYPHKTKLLYHPWNKRNGLETFLRQKNKTNRSSVTNCQAEPHLVGAMRLAVKSWAGGSKFGTQGSEIVFVGVCQPPGKEERHCPDPPRIAARTLNRNNKAHAQQTRP